MELLLTPHKSKRQYQLPDQLSFSKDRIVNVIGRDFNKSIANIVGLASLLDDIEVSNQDLKIIQKYLTIEANKLSLMVKDICS